MTLFELILAVVVIVCATVVCILLGDVPPVLAGILGVAIGYVGKAAVNSSPLPTSQNDGAFKGAPPA